MEEENSSLGVRNRNIGCSTKDENLGLLGVEEYRTDKNKEEALRVEYEVNDPSHYQH
jgi:hypothetical protein